MGNLPCEANVLSPWCIKSSRHISRGMKMNSRMTNDPWSSSHYSLEIVIIMESFSSIRQDTLPALIPFRVWKCVYNPIINTIKHNETMASWYRVFMICLLLLKLLHCFIFKIIFNRCGSNGDHHSALINDINWKTFFSFILCVVTRWLILNPYEAKDPRQVTSSI